MIGEKGVARPSGRGSASAGDPPTTDFLGGSEARTRKLELPTLRHQLSREAQEPLDPEGNPRVGQPEGTTANGRSLPARSEARRSV